MRVVERGRAVDRRLADRLLERRDVVGERLAGSGPGCRSRSPRLVVLAHAAGEADRRFLRRPQLVLHARAGVEQERQRDRLLRPSRRTSSAAWRRPRRPRTPPRSRSVTYLPAVGDGDVERHELDAAAEWRLRRDGGGRSRPRRRRRAGGRRDWSSHQRAARVRARTVTLGRFAVTSIFSGGISVSGRP